MRSAADLLAAKAAGKKIAVITAYDYATAAACDAAGADVLLVGDSAGMVMLGHKNTTGVTMEHMRMFTGAVAAAKKGALVVADMPFMSYQPGKEEAIRNAGALVAAGADAVKLEGGEAVAEIVSAITRAGIPVMGHIGVQPQTAALGGGYAARGKSAKSAAMLAADARALEEAGAFAVVLEVVASEAAEAITRAAGIPTIGIGSGAGCDGQVLVLHDMLGLYQDMRPKFAKRYLDLAGQVQKAVGQYCTEVRTGQFPGPEHAHMMDDGQAARLGEEIGS